MKKQTILFLTILGFLLSCKPTQKETPISTTQNNSIIVNSSVTHPGKKLLETKCFVCHSPKTAHDERIAPPMVAIKAHYIDENTSETTFTKEFLNFVQNPTKENAKMYGAVKRFGVMPYQKFEEKDLKKIANYLFNYEIEEPEWFKEHWKSEQGKGYINSGKKVGEVNPSKTPEELGLSYALDTKKVLGKNLMGTIQKKGTLNALAFCNEKAYPLTDSMAIHFNASIKRVSDKPRNSNNAANTEEIEIINEYKKIIDNKEEVKPIVKQTEEQVTFYYPIVTNSMCLQCHGNPKTQIQPEVLQKIAQLYPNDNAQGYDVNQVRGIWSIQFKNNTTPIQ
ncbi:c-type heme family protein [Tenacibaculum sp. TC6]|uniref:c-type heme family protein n=1 Tax=Tenacibaculum sp. TC6 TaxID=3423223 RepID=UPI003D35EF51